MSTIAKSENKANLSQWISYGLPFRPVIGTYGWCRGPLPALDEDALKPFVHLQTLQDVARSASDIDKLLASPTACRVTVNVESGLLYTDSQGCVLWYFDLEHGVHVRLAEQDKQLEFVTVAPSLCEFFARLNVESEIFHAHTKAWFAAGLHSKLGNDLFACCREKSPGVGPVEDVAATWTALQGVLTKAQIAYLEGYYQQAHA